MPDGRYVLCRLPTSGSPFLSAVSPAVLSLSPLRCRVPGWPPRQQCRLSSGRDCLCCDNKVLPEAQQYADQCGIKILNDAVATDSLIVWMVDLFAFNGTLNPDVVKKVKKLNVVVIGSKRDLFPSFVTDSMLIRYLDERFSEVGINPVEIRLIGNEDHIDINDAFNVLKEQRKYRDVYLIGELNSGKTTLINKFLKNYVNKTKWQIKTELYPGTNSNILEIPLSNSSFLYELPDLSNSTSVISKVEKDIQKIIIPKIYWRR